MPGVSHESVSFLPLTKAYTLLRMSYFSFLTNTDLDDTMIVSLMERKASQQEFI